MIGGGETKMLLSRAECISSFFFFCQHRKAI